MRFAAVVLLVLVLFATAGMPQRKDDPSRRSTCALQKRQVFKPVKAGGVSYHWGLNLHRIFPQKTVAWSFASFHGQHGCSHRFFFDHGIRRRVVGGLPYTCVIVRHALPVSPSRRDESR